MAHELAQRSFVRHGQSRPFTPSRVCPNLKGRRPGVAFHPLCSANKPTHSRSPFSSAQPRAPKSARLDSQVEDPSTSTSYTTHKWSWRGHTINYATAGCGKPILLVHGFGANLQHYRKTIPALATHYKVYAIDLLGFGESDKPVQQYMIETWARLVADFVSEFMVGQAPVLVGNSIGSLVCLTAASLLGRSQLSGLVLLNSAGAMNNKGVVSDWRIMLAYPLFLLIDLLLSIKPVAAYLFNSFRRRETIAKVLQSVYCNADAVDEQLVDIIVAPSEHPNALDVFTSVITGPPGPKPWDLMPEITAPMLVVWGDTDPFTPLDGPVGQYFKGLAGIRDKTDFVLLKDVGHCPQDDRPELLHEELLPWLKKTLTATAA